MPLISVIMPVRNASGAILAAIESILRQSERDFELILIDDGSTDDTPDKLARLSDPRIRIIHHKEPRGIAASLNRGIDLSSGAFLMRMDADDVSSPNRFGAQVRLLRSNKKIGVCGTWARALGQGRRFILTWPIEPGALHAYTYFDNPFAHPSVCMRRSMLEESGFRYDERLAAAQDMDLWARMAGRVLFQNIPKVLLYYRIHPQGVTSSRALESDAVACSVLDQRLSSAGIILSADELTFHRKTGHGAGVGTWDELNVARTWLNNIGERLVASGHVTRQDVTGALSFIWWRICLNSAHLGIEIVKSYRSTVWTNCHKPFEERLAMLWFAAKSYRFGRPGKPKGHISSWNSSK